MNPPPSSPSPAHDCFGQLGESLPSSLGALSSLVSLTLNANQLSGETVEASHAFQICARTGEFIEAFEVTCHYKTLLGQDRGGTFSPQNMKYHIPWYEI